MRVEDSKRASEFPVIDDPREIERAIQSGEGIRFGSLEACPISSFDNSESFIFVWGIVYYDDGFGGRRFTRFCHRYPGACRSEEHTSELQSLMRISYAVFCLKKKKHQRERIHNLHQREII